MKNVILAEEAQMTKSKSYIYSESTKPPFQSHSHVPNQSLFPHLFSCGVVLKDLRDDSHLIFPIF